MPKIENINMVGKASSNGDIDLVHLPSSNLEGKVEDVDDCLLRAQGHNAEMERSFSWVGAIGLAYSITNSWLTYASCIGLALKFGGGATAVFGLVLAAGVQWIVLLGLAELSSAFPSSGGQYHFAYILAPKATKDYAAYITGMINILAWWITTSSGTLYTAISAFGCATVWFPNFAQKQYQVYLCYLGVIAISLLPIMTIPHHHIDKMTKTSMAFSLVGMIATIIVCLATSPGHYQPGSILVDMHGSSGWNAGASWLLSIAIGMYCFAGTGAVTHIAEELPRPGRKVPLVINMTMLIGTIGAVPWIIVMLLCIRDLEAVQGSFLPVMEIFYQATGSKAGATALQAYLTFLYYTCIPSQWITSSRITWAFARDNGLPFSNYWKHIDMKRGFPVRATYLSAAFCAIYGLLYIASTAAYNSIINAAVLMLNITFTIPQGILVTTGRRKLPSRAFSLGNFGYAINLFSVCWLIVSGVVMCLPNALPTSAGSMNYNSAVVSGLFLILCLLWIERRKKFSGPNIDWNMLNEMNKLS